MYSSSNLISVAMASYNGEKYIVEQLESIIKQTHKNIEIIITDDCSCDGTVDIINEFIKRYSFISLYKNQTNIGITKTFENSLRHCKGKYIAISDQDDVWDKEKLSILANAIADEDAAYGNSLFVDETCKSLHTDFKSVMHLQSYYSGAPFLLGNCLPGHSLLMKYDFVQTLFPFPDGIMFDRWISFKASANNGIKYVDLILVNYRQHQNNAVGTKKRKKHLKQPKTISDYDKKLNELTVYTKTYFKDQKTREILNRMLVLFNKRWSFQRSLFFFKNFHTILIIKNKSTFRKILYCIKMFFKANY